MRVYISSDLEGVNGVVHSSQTQPGAPGYEQAVALMHDELAAIVEGLVEGGARDIVVADAHWDARNLRMEMLPEGVRLVSGWQRPDSMMSGVSGSIGGKSLGGPFDCAVFHGYHAMAGAACGVLSHTYRAKVFDRVELDGKPVGEFGLNAALAGFLDVPVAMVSGDDALCDEAQAVLPDIVAVPVKQAVSRYSAVLYPGTEVLDQLREGGRRALESRHWQLVRAESPAKIRLHMHDSSMADACELIPDARRVGDSVIELSHENYGTLFRLFLACGVLGASRKDDHF